MKIRAFGYKIWTKEESYTIRKMAAVVDPTAEVEITDLISYDSTEVDPDDVILLFGKQAQQKYKGHKCRARAEFRAIHRLVPSLGEDELREEALKKLLQLKETLDSNSPADEDTTEQMTEGLVEDPLPTFKCDQVKALEETQKEFRGTTDDGRTFKLTPRPSTKDADICMTFAELWNLKALKDVLHVKELNFVHRRATSSRKGSSQ